MMVATDLANSMSCVPAQADTVEHCINLIGPASVQDQALYFGLVSGVAETGITFTNGDTVYLSTTEAGKITNVTPTSGCVYELGQVYAFNSMFIFRPSFKYQIV